jgi:RimJ/RimL family protein N-acetyltransferase
MFTGSLVTLRPHSSADDDNAHRWLNDMEAARLLGDRYPRSRAATRPRVDVDRMPSFDAVRFGVDTRDGRHIGWVNLFDTSPESRSAQLGVFIGEREYWSRGYGSQAVALALDFAFDEMNLHRVWLQVWSFNPRAIAAYRKLGFIEEARLRRDLYAMGEYHEVIVMGVLEDEWRARRLEASARRLEAS